MVLWVVRPQLAHGHILHCQLAKAHYLQRQDNGTNRVLPRERRRKRLRCTTCRITATRVVVVEDFKANASPNNHALEHRPSHICDNNTGCLGIDPANEGIMERTDAM